MSEMKFCRRHYMLGGPGTKRNEKRMEELKMLPLWLNKAPWRRGKSGGKAPIIISKIQGDYKWCERFL